MAKRLTAREKLERALREYAAAVLSESELVEWSILLGVQTQQQTVYIAEKSQ